MNNKFKNSSTVSMSEIKKLQDEKAKIYIKLVGESKNEETYQQKLNDFIIDYCSQTFNIKLLKGDLWYGSDYNINKEIEIRNNMINAVTITKSYFKSYKTKEKKDIKSDTNISQDEQKKFIKVLDDTFKNVNLKMDIVKEQFGNDLIILINEYKKHKYEAVSDSKVIEKMKAIAHQSKKDINEYCYKIICNNTNLLKLDSLRQLTNTYSSIVARTLDENITYINNAIATSNYAELANIFISEFNKNVKLEKKRILENS